MGFTYQQQGKPSPARDVSSCTSAKPDLIQNVHYFDICRDKSAPVVKLKPSLLEKNREKRQEVERRKGSSHRFLQTGMVLLENHIIRSDQIKIVKKCRELGIGLGGFYIPGYDSGSKLQLRMMCLGKNWEPQSKEYVDVRSVDGAKAPIIPEEFKKLAEEAIQYSHELLIKEKYKIENVKEILPLMHPDICIVNFYTQSGKLGLHQDRDESPESLHKRLPVVSFSIGDDAEFLYGDDRDVDKAKKVTLKSGDVLIFGGESRHIFHGVSSIIPNSAPKYLSDDANLRPGRINLTFRQY
ncbi:hypothetical protein GIB67_037751 [Kingdonia uniflora]|uniref:Fe2OG dioxygenase domain-containing protein n=1 Tax=Kingdonia uniflora TaxID=39325 RepID=A0A7J7LUW0_9MAGN|nr:hypothetical protein GIB67_037751 [Kingdonia uniflora]